MATSSSFTEFIAGIVTRNTLVSDADPHQRWKPVIVKTGDDLLEVLKKYISLHEIRTVAVVDEDDRLVGVIRETTLADDILFHIMPAEFLAGALGADGMAELASRMGARVATDLMQAPVFVKKEDNLKDAFAKMRRNRLYGLPIVDDNMRVVGYLDMQEILAVWLKAMGRGDSS
jgi:CBS domain-containing protein